MEIATVEVGKGVVIGGELPVLIMGPCVIESPEHTLAIAQRLRDLCARHALPLVFKASFDKANRTSHASYRGPGIAAGLAVLAAVREQTGLPVTTDVHEPHQVEQAADVVDLLQVPAFLCRQTDLLQACAASGRATSVKKGQFLAGWDCRPIVEKFRAAGGRELVLMERGNSFGYNRLVADLCNLPAMRALGVPVVFDGTHSVQSPGGGGDVSLGSGHLAPGLMRAALAMGCEGLFLEVHDDPAAALSDGANVIPCDELDGFLGQIRTLHDALGRPTAHAVDPHTPGTQRQR
ncbi:MAG: 3-deoxy-8-phosphooctulonate synthase [Planctomycetota bacterium]